MHLFLEVAAKMAERIQSRTEGLIASVHSVAPSAASLALEDRTRAVEPMREQMHQPESSWSQNVAARFKARTPHPRHRPATHALSHWCLRHRTLLRALSRGAAC